MGRTFLLSDFHGDINFKGFNEYLEIANDDDLLIILGDVGLFYKEREDNALFTEKFLNTKKKIAFIDGNHENMDYIDSLPEIDFCGGKAGKLTDYILHLKRGHIFNINGKKLFVFGGYKSSQKWKDLGLWYEREWPSKEEFSLGYKTLKENNNKVDFVLTHRYQAVVNPLDEIDELVKYIDDNVQFEAWYSGHTHTIETLDDKHFRVYNELTKITDN